MADNSAAFVCATALWIACLTAVFYGPRRTAESWVATASGTRPSPPILVGAHVRAKPVVLGSTTTP
jgi:hypothetical protein